MNTGTLASCAAVSTSLSCDADSGETKASAGPPMPMVVWRERGSSRFVRRDGFQPRYERIA